MATLLSGSAYESRELSTVEVNVARQSAKKGDTAPTIPVGSADSGEQKISELHAIEAARRIFQKPNINRPSIRTVDQSRAMGYFPL
jgi:hypothetical protein